ncbi:MAG: signal peptide peptidase SppA [Muribaculaceae bacterium]|nr:signal peptide peptidase SppA [Muribaculaceae bacterium]
MLKRFFLNALSSFLGAWVAIVIFGAVCVMVIVGLIARLGVSQATQNQVTKDSILTIDLKGEIDETEMPVDFDYSTIVSGDISKKQSLALLTSAIEAAAENKNIKAIYLKCNSIASSPATLNAIRNSLLKFKESKKKIIAYGDMLAMGDYYIATVADELYMNPGGNLALKGLGGITPFFKGLFEKIGIEFQVVKVGTYKSAVEPYINEQMSEPARAQLDTLYGSMWGIICDGICEERKGVTPAKIDSLINDDFIFLRPAKTAVTAGMVDGLYYERSMDSIIAVGINKKKEDLNFVDPSLLVTQEQLLTGLSSKNQIALVYASGEILDGGGGNTINYEKYVPLIVSLAENENVKGMVLRVNSPGGSVFGSEQIGEALDYFQSKGKPLAVSMGDYAASGGYWISSCANRIFADPLTITGSIGIFGLIPNVEGLTKKLGVNMELVSTNPEAVFPSLFQPLNSRQLKGMQEMVEDGYDRFVSRVAKGRHMSENKVRRIGEGRVWDAVTAMKIGLVDQLGGVEDAIEWVAQDLNIENYDVTRYPRYETSVWDLLPNVMNMQLKEQIRKSLSTEISPVLLKRVERTLSRKPLQALMPEIQVGFISN